MKTLILNIIARPSVSLIQDCIIVLAGIGCILLTVEALYFFNLIKAYSWQ